MIRVTRRVSVEIKNKLSYVSCETKFIVNSISATSSKEMWFFLYKGITQPFPPCVLGKLCSYMLACKLHILTFAALKIASSYSTFMVTEGSIANVASHTGVRDFLSEEAEIRLGRKCCREIDNKEGGGGDICVNIHCWEMKMVMMIVETCEAPSCSQGKRKKTKRIELKTNRKK